MTNNKNKRDRSAANSGAPRKGSDLMTLVRLFIDSSLAGGEPTIAKAAEAAGMSIRTLQRRLLDEGVTFNQLLNEVRLETAIRLLVLSEINLGETARALGYSDAAHFTRAFKRWTGEMPSSFRRRLRRGCGRRR